MFKLQTIPLVLCFLLLLPLVACAENPEVTKLKQALENTDLPFIKREDAIQKLTQRYGSQELSYLKKIYLTENDPRYDQAIKGALADWLMFHDTDLIEFLITPYIEGACDTTPPNPEKPWVKWRHNLHALPNFAMTQGWGKTKKESQKRFDFYRRDLLGEFPYQNATDSAKTLLFSYGITEEEHPDLFAAIRKEIRAGNLSIPGLLHGSSLGGVSKEKRKMLTELIMEKSRNIGGIYMLEELKTLPLEEKLALWDSVMEIRQQEYAEDPEGYAKCNSCTSFLYFTDPERTKPFLLKLLRKHRSNSAATELLLLNDPEIDKEIGAMIQELVQIESPDLETKRFCQKMARLADTRVFSQEFYVQQMLGTKPYYRSSAEAALQKYPDPFDAKTLRKLYKHRPERAYIKAFERLPDTPENALFLADIALANKLNTGASHARGVLRKWKYKWVGDCWEKDGKTILCKGDKK